MILLAKNNTCLVWLLVKYFISKLTWNVQQSDSNENQVVIENKVDFVGHGVSPDPLVSNMGQWIEQAGKFTRYSDWVKSNEERVPEPNNKLRKANKVQEVVAITDDFSDGPSEKEEGKSDTDSGWWADFKDSPQDKHTGEYLKRCEDDVGLYDSRCSVEDLKLKLYCDKSWIIYWFIVRKPLHLPLEQQQFEKSEGEAG